MKLFVIVLLWALFAITHQTTTQDNCVCEFISSEKSFPHEKLKTVQDSASNCNNIITPQKAFVLKSVLLGLDRRLPQLEEDVAVLEKEDDGELYGVLSLHVIENELSEIQQLIDKLNSTASEHKRLSDDTAQKLEDVQEEMQELETFDAMQVVKKQQVNQRLKRDLDRCKNGGLHPIPQPTEPTEETCPHGQLLNVTGPRVFTAGEYPGSYKYGAWGRDPKPEAGKESWYWLVMMTSSNIYSNYVRFYSTLSALIVGVSVPGNIQIHASNPTTNTIQGPNVVLYGGALYYNCYNKDAVCRFNITTKTITSLELPKGTRYNSKANFCHLEECYLYTDLDLATDESGVWVVYTTTQDFGNLILSKVEEGEVLTLGQTWRTSFPKRGVTNTFMACGILYATRFVNTTVEEIFYSFDTRTGKENFNVGILIHKMSPNILSLNYSPVDQMLYAYCDSKIVSYQVLFQKGSDSYL
ncbi:olfactomedin-4-like [Kryptolebias marmoratus]|uniref:Olfactomedin-4-like n=1 Tax=Kryptolebias marmoratus TaxID=37003 RepID=A0A3Q2ZVP6_KRYMA|nr:olfactomedin-4-like [Kryptolebias marmoratus]